MNRAAVRDRQVLYEVLPGANVWHYGYSLLIFAFSHPQYNGKSHKDRMEVDRCIE